MPWAPGTWGTLAALPIWWCLSGASLTAWLVVVVAVSGLSIVVASRAERLYDVHDVSEIVIDEVAGMLVCVVGIPFEVNTVLVAFIVFRFLDGVKPPPIRWCDQTISGGLGVVLDDIVAGLLGLAIMHGLGPLVGWT